MKVLKKKHGSRLSHGMYGSPTYYSWCSMKQRCLNPKASSYESYGGRGILICEKWLTFEGFFKDMGLRPDGKSLERVDVNGGYNLGNCCWATSQEQARNRRGSWVIVFAGQKKPATEWAEEYGLCITTLRMRINSGWTLADAILTPAEDQNKK